MAVEKKDREFTDAKGNLHKHFADGRSEMYIGGFYPRARYVEVTDTADAMVNRKRFILQEPLRVEDTLQVRDDPEENGVPGVDSLDEESATEFVSDED